MVTVQVDRVEFAAGRADAAADAFVRIDDGGAAAKAAGGLDLNLFLGQRAVGVAERIFGSVIFGFLTAG